jgi:Arc/MetJ-type ribon-helix-helix transcriptional regulator
MGELRKLKTKIKPVFKNGEEGTSELENGEVGKGLPLVRNYIDNLDMDFYAGRASPSKQHSEPVTVKFPSDLIKDIAIIIESRKTQYRDRSELIRSATYILINYLANRLKRGFQERATLRDIIDIERVESNDRERLKTICNEFEKSFKEVKEYDDFEIDKFIRKRVNAANNQPKGFNRKEMLKKFYKVIEENGIDPIHYINKEDIE